MNIVVGINMGLIHTEPSTFIETSNVINFKEKILDNTTDFTDSKRVLLVSI